MRIGFLVVVAACSHGPGAGPSPTFLTQRFSNELDLLFVLDNSGGTSDEQTVLAANVPKLVAAFDAFPTGRPSLHIAVVDSTVDIGDPNWGPGCPSPDPADDGLLQNTPRITGCSAPNGRFIVDEANIDGTRTTNYVGTLDAAFSCIAQVGGTGCGFQAPLEGMKRALDNSRPENAGFLRDDASLGILIMSDGDDCSAQDPMLFGLTDAGPGSFRCTALGYQCDQPISTTHAGTYTNCRPALGSYLRDPADYYAFVRAARPEQRVSVEIISGGAPANVSTMIFPSTPPELVVSAACSATLNGGAVNATPAIRLGSFLASFGSDGLAESICRSDYSSALTDFGALVQHMMKPCVADAIDATDVDLVNPGIQPDCTVSEGTVTGAAQALPLCEMLDDTTPDTSNPACAWFAVDPTCGTPTNLAVHAMGAGPQIAISCGS